MIYDNFLAFQAPSNSAYILIVKPNLKISSDANNIHVVQGETFKNFFVIFFSNLILVSDSRLGLCQNPWVYPYGDKKSNIAKTTEILMTWHEAHARAVGPTPLCRLNLDRSSGPTSTCTTSLKRTT